MRFHAFRGKPSLYRRKSRYRHRTTRIEQLEPRQLLAADWQNPFVSRDVNDNGVVDPLDALVAINQLNSRTLVGTNGELPSRSQHPNEPYYDTTGDGLLTPQDVLFIINALNGDEQGPTVTAGLAQDTGPNGIMNADGLTSVAMISGQVLDNLTGVRSLVVQVDQGTSQNVPVARDGSFQFDPGLAGDGSADGPHTIQFTAVDGRLNQSPAFSIAFTFDTEPPPTPQFDLAPTSDSGVPGDRATQAARVTLAGMTEGNAFVTLTEVGQTVRSSGDGAFRIPNVSLVPGSNVIALRAVDLAGNTSDTQQAFMHVDEPGGNDPVLRWIEAALDAIRLDATPPPAATRGLAMLNLAMLDVVNAIEGTPGFLVSLPAPNAVATEAAISTAAFRVMSYLFPGQVAALQTVQEGILDEVPDGAAETNGIDFGTSVGDAVIAWRGEDGWDQFIDYVPQTSPGQWQATSPMYDVALLPQWGQVAPLAVSNVQALVPDGIPPFADPQWAEAFNEVKSVGSATSSVRTAEQTQIARFWADGPGTNTPPGHWNQIAMQFSQSERLSVGENARLFAMLNAALGDASIVTWQAKYTTAFWRPITAIQNADQDGNDQTAADSDWRPLLITPPFPEYPSGHSTYSSAAAEILSAYFGDNQSFSTTSVGLPGVTRSFTSFRAAAEEAGQSRIYGGIHYPFSNQDGLASGRAIAAEVLERFTVRDDTRPPQIVILSPAAGSVTQANPTVEGWAIDNLSGVAGAEVRVDDGGFVPVTLDASGRFQFQPALALDGTADGQHVLHFRADDQAGLQSDEFAFSFTLDTQPPTNTIASPADGATIVAGQRLEGTVSGTGSPVVSLRYQIDDGPLLPVSFHPAGGSYSQPLDLSRVVAGDHTLVVRIRDAAGFESATTVPFTLGTAVPLNVSSHTPLSGVSDVGSTFRPQIFFSRPIDLDTLSPANFFATDASGAVLPATIVPAQDGSFAWLFFATPLPGGSTITVHVDGETIQAADGTKLDADRDGTAGGELRYDFTTVSLVPLPGTRLSGRVLDPGDDLKPMTFDDMQAGDDDILYSPDDVFLHPISHARVYILGLEDQAVFTDENGHFSLDAVPGGIIKLAIDGRTATNALPGTFWPEMVMDMELEVGRANTVMGSMGTREERRAHFDRSEVYLPRLQTSILTPIFSGQPTTVVVEPVAAPNLTPEQRQFLSLEVQPGSILGEDGLPLANPQVGISAVPPELVRDMLPPGLLQHTFDITIQAPGASTFSAPASLTFPNVFHAAPGTQLSFLSFDHTTGRLVIEGTATVSADGLSVSTDPDMGITHPGWHGVTPPGSEIEVPPCYTERLYAELGLVAPPEVVVPPIPKIGEVSSGFFGSESIIPPQDRFYYDTLANQPGFTLYFKNDAQKVAPAEDACSLENLKASAMIVKIEIDGPIGRITRFLTSQSFALLPQQEKRINVLPRDLFAALYLFDNDQIYAARVRITAYQEGHPGNLLYDRHFDLARFIGVVNAAEGRTLKAPFIKTLADGPGNFARTKQVDYVLPNNVDTVFVPDLTGAVLRNNLKVSGTYRGNGTAIWTFDPDGAGTYRTSLELEIGGSYVGSAIGSNLIDVVGVGIAPSAIGVGRSQYEGLLLGFLLDPDNFNGINAHQASAAFQTQFSGVLPASSPTPVALLAAVQAAGQALVDAVTRDFTPANVGGVGFLVVDNGGDVSVTWEEIAVFPNSGSEVAGFADGDFDRGVFMAAVSNRNLPRAAIEYAFTKSVNMKPTNSGTFGFRINTLLGGNRVGSDPRTPSFADYVAGTVSHELGHTFGLLDAYFAGIDTLDLDGNGNTTERIVETVFPWDLMGAKSRLDPDKSFHASTQMVLQAAIGLAPSNVGGLFSAIDLTKKNFKLPTSTIGLHENEDPPLEIPVLDVRDGDLGLLDRSLVSAGTVLADGPAGEFTDLSFTLSNAGLMPLTISSVTLSPLPDGFQIVGGDPTGQIIDAGESRPLTIRFDPQNAGKLTRTLTIATNDRRGPFTLTLEGNGLTTSGQIEIVVPNGDDGPLNNVGGLRLEAASRVVDGFATVRNVGGGPLTITGFQMGDVGAGQFTVTAPPGGFPVVLNPGDELPFGLTFDANLVGLQGGEVRVFSNDPLTPVAVQTVVGTGLPDAGTAIRIGNDYIAIETGVVENGPVLRATSDDRGNFTFFLPPETGLHIVYFDPASGLVAHDFEMSASSGRPTGLNNPVFRASTAPDTDGDFLPDDIEFAIGTSSTKRDTNGDGLSDFQALKQGLDPLRGVAFPTGVVAAAALQGDAREVEVASSPADETQRLAYVATGTHGLAIVDVTQFDRPIVLSQFDLAGTSSDVAVDLPRQLAAVAGGSAGLHLVDIADPASPQLRQTIPLGNALQVELFDGTAFVAAGDSLTSVDLFTGDVLQELALGVGTITGLAQSESFLYVTGTARGLQVIEISGFSLFERGSLILPQGGGSLFAASGLVYAAAADNVAGGFVTVNVSDPDNPVLISGSDVDPNVGLAGTDLALNGSGLGLMVGRTGGGSNVLDVLDVSDPEVTDAFLTRFALPANPFAVTIADGMAFVAGGTAGLQIVNVLPFDTQDNPPAVNIVSPVEDVNLAAGGVQIVEGTPIPVRVQVTDDVQVRRVELLVKGGLFAVDISFPFEFNVVAPVGVTPGTSFTLQARGIDSGGNSTLSNPLVFELVEDTLPPTVSLVTPADGEQQAPGLRFIRVDFSEPLAAGSADGNRFQLWDGNLQLVAPLLVELRNGDRSVQLIYPPLPAGDYQLNVVAAGVTDRAGNSLAADFSSQFSLLQAGVFWIGGDGFWNDPANWSTGAVPGPNDDVLISVPGSVTVQYDGQNELIQQIRSLISDENMIVRGGNSGEVGSGLAVAEASQIRGNLLIESGQLGGDGRITLSGVTTWNGGMLFGTGGVTNNGAMTVSATEFPLLSTTLDNAGTLVAAPLTAFRLSDGTLNNLAGGTFDLRGGVVGVIPGTTNRLANAGQFRKTTAADAFLQVPFDNTGELLLQGGNLSLSAGGTNADASYDVASGTILHFAGGAHTFAGASLASGDGLVRIGSTVGGAGNLELAGNSEWTGGILTGAGGVTNSGVLTISAGGTRQLTGVLNNVGTIQHLATGALLVTNGTINNQPGGTYHLQAGSFTLGFNSTAVFNNAGLVTKTGATAVAFLIPFHNAAAVDVQGGELELRNGGDHGGAFAIADGASVAFTGGTHTLQDGVQFSGAGQLRFTAGTITINGNVTAGRIQQLGGTLNGPGELTVMTQFDWEGGTQAGSGTTRLPGGSMLNIRANATKQLTDRTLENAGTATLSGNGLLRFTNAAFHNQPTGVFDVASDTSLTVSGGSGTFQNEGTFRKSGGTGASAVQPGFQNSGTVQISTGTLNFTSFVQTAGETRLSGGSLQSGSLIDIQGGTLNGGGTVTGSIRNGGVINPGGAGAAGTLTVTGNYTQTAAGVLALELGGTAPAEFDVLRTNTAPGSQSATLGGALSVLLINGFTVTAGDNFVVMEFDSRSGDFATNQGLDPGGGLVLQKQFSGTALSLDALQTLAAAGPRQPLDPREVDEVFGSEAFGSEDWDGEW